MKHTEVLSLLVLSFCLNSESQAQLVTYDFEGEVASPAQADANLVASDFLRNEGNTVAYATGNGGGDAISGSGWTGADTSNDKYWEFTLTAIAGITLDLNAMAFDYRSTSTGPTSWELSINGAPAGSGAFQNDATFRLVSIPLSFSDLSSAVVRLSGYGAASSGGTLRVDNVRLDGLSVQTVPEPATWLLLVAGLLFFSHRFRGRKWLRP